MNILKTRPEPANAALLTEVAIELCRFANGSCECRERGRRLCERTEFVASKIINIVNKKTGGAA